jgi:hypothetical protein
MTRSSRHRLMVLERIRSDARPDLIVADMKAVYREYPAQMIVDWGVTVDPQVTPARQTARGDAIYSVRQSRWSCAT